MGAAALVPRPIQTATAHVPEEILAVTFAVANLGQIVAHVGDLPGEFAVRPAAALGFRTRCTPVRSRVSSHDLR